MASQIAQRLTNFLPKTRTVFLALFFGSALLTGGLACATRFHWTPDQLDADEREYYEMGKAIMEGRYEFTPRRMIGHALVLGTLRKTLGDRILTIQLVVSLLFSLSAPLTYLLVKRELGSPRVALLAGLGVMAWPLYVRYGATLYSETLAFPVFIATLLAFPKPRSDGATRLGRWVAAGTMLGLCMHIRPMYLLYSPFAALIAFWRKGTVRVRILSVVLLAAGCLLVVLPWSIFLSLREGGVILLSNTGGETLAGGLNPELIRMNRQATKQISTPSDRVTWLGPGKWLTPEQTGFLSPQEQTLSYNEQSKLLFRRAVAWIKAEPGDAAYIQLRKLSYMWGIYPFWNGRSQTLLGNVPTIGLLVLGFVAVVRLRGHLRELAMFWTLPVFVSVVAMISWGSWRFRQPGDLGLIVLAATLPWSSEVKRFLSGEGPQTTTVTEP